jgi:lipopolysaccharide exporter
VGDLGFYSMAYRLSDITYWAIAEPVSKATFPGFARMRHRGEGTREALYRVTRTVTITACPAGVILSAVAGPFTLTVFGSKWGAMINALAILGVWAAVRPYSTTLGWYLLAVGHAKVVGVISIIVVVPQVVALGTAASLGGIEEVAWVMVCSSGVSAMIWSVLAVRSTAVTAADLVKAVRPVVLACGAAWIGAHAATKPFASRPAVSLVLATMVGATSYLFTVRIVEPDALSQAARRVRRVVSFGE